MTHSFSDCETLDELESKLNAASLDAQGWLNYAHSIPGTFRQPIQARSTEELRRAGAVAWNEEAAILMVKRAKRTGKYLQFALVPILEVPKGGGFSA